MPPLAPFAPDPLGPPAMQPLNGSAMANCPPDAGHKDLAAFPEFGTGKVSGQIPSKSNERIQHVLHAYRSQNHEVYGTMIYEIHVPKV